MTTHGIERTEDVLAETVLAPSRPKLVLSPHLDDALLSAYAAIDSGPCEVWTVFAGHPSPAQTTSWDTACGFPDSDHTLAARLREDEAAFAGTAAQVRRLPGLDGAYTNPRRRTDDLAMLRGDLKAWMRENPDGIVIAPVGAGLHVPQAWWQRAKERLTGEKPVPVSGDTASAAGSEPSPPTGHTLEARTEEGRAESSQQDTSPARTLRAVTHVPKDGLRRAVGIAQRAMHADAQRRRRRVLGHDGLAANPDHLDVRDLALEATAAHPGVDLLLFEDLPYLWHARGDAEADRLRAVSGCDLTSVTVEVDRDLKFARLAAYTSQMPVMDSKGRLLQASTLPAGETYWLVSR